MNRIISISVVLLCGMCAFWYHHHVVSGYEAELASIKSVYAQAQAKIAIDTAEIFNQALSKREGQYVDNNKAGKTASISIATATTDAESVDADGLLPSGINAALLLQYERVCSGGPCGISSGSVVPAEAYSWTSG